MTPADGHGAAQQPGRVLAVTSLANPRIKAIAGLAQPKHRRDSGLFIAEGLKLVTDAIEENWPIDAVIYASEAGRTAAVQNAAARARARGADIIEVSASVLAKVTRRDNPQTVVGVFHQRWTPLQDIRAEAGAPWVALEAVRDPGNLGTILRTIDAVGARGAILIGETVDPFGIEAVRATMGSLFHVGLARMAVAEFLKWRPCWAGAVVGTHLGGRSDYRNVAYDRPTLLVMGNEQAGLSGAVAAACDTLVRIPQAGHADSLNLAVATGVLLFEIQRPHLSLAPGAAAR